MSSDDLERATIVLEAVSFLNSPSGEGSACVLFTIVSSAPSRVPSI